MRSVCCVESFVTILRGQQICTAAPLSAARHREPAIHHTEPLKATKGRRMSKKSRKNPSKPAVIAADKETVKKTAKPAPNPAAKKAAKKAAKTIATTAKPAKKAVAK